MNTATKIYFAGLLAMGLAINAQAAPIYVTSILDTGGINNVAEGTTSASYSAGSSTGSASASVNIIGTEIQMEAQHSGYYVGLSPRGYMIFNDVIFTDLTNPEAVGNVNVSMNFLTTSTGPSRGIDVSAGLRPVSDFSGTPSSPQSNLFSDTIVAGTYTTATISVPLNVALSLSFDSRIKPFPGFYGFLGKQNEIATATARLADMVFNLDAGITVNSLDAGIVNNSLSTVPVPAAAWLFGSALLGVFGFSRRKKLTA